MSEAQSSVAKAEEDNDEKYEPSSQALSYHIASQVFLCLSFSIFLIVPKLLHKIDDAIYRRFTNFLGASLKNLLNICVCVYFYNV